MPTKPAVAPLIAAARSLPLLTLALLAACGGADRPADPAAGLTGSAASEPAAPVATGTTTIALDPATLPDDAKSIVAQPAFHAAPVLLDAPDDTDLRDPSASATRGPRTQAIPAEFAGLSTRRLTLQTLEAGHRVHALGAGPAAAGGITPLAGTNSVATYSPAQIRAAYGLPALPAAGTALTAAQAAQLGAGQTIYIVDAFDDPNVVAELMAFNQKFGLPGCATKTISPNTSLPLLAPGSSGCEFAVVASKADGTLASSLPAYDAGWATEIALDVQWAHATAPLARIVLIEAASPSVDNLLGAVKLANAMGPGVVSMSFGGNEGSYTASVDAAFSAPNMSYLAATGDNGAGVSWPAVSPKVLAVGATSLNFSGSGPRSEAAWANTGGGISAYTATPSYQSAAVPGLGALAKRSVADVAFNGDSSTGQYVAVMPSGSTAVRWMSIGGTSLSTPQWAGILAVANAVRAQAGKAAIGAPHAALYGQVATVPGTYASTFADITQGRNGSCASCAAKSGYDVPTGLGTPNVDKLLTTLAGGTAAPVPPVVTAATINGTAGTALSFTVSVTAPNRVSYTLNGAPAGMSISDGGAVNWATPVAGTWTVTVTATDGTTGLSGQGVYNIVIATPAAPIASKAPVVSSLTVSGKAGVALAFNTSVSAANPVSYSLANAPSGMVVSTAGVISWPSPVAGSYAVTLMAKDSKTGLSGQGVVTVQIGTNTANAGTGPVITAAPITGVAGKAVSGSISIAAPGATSLSITISGVPMGMTFSANGLTLTASWANPVAGSYTLKVVVVDGAGRSATSSVPILINAK